MTERKPHSRLPDETFYALVNAVTSRFQTIGDSRKVVDQDGLRREYERILSDFFEQLEAAQLAFRVLAECAWSYYDVSPPTEHRKEWYVIIDGSALVDEKSAKAVEAALDPLIAELATAESNPAKELREPTRWERIRAYAAGRDPWEDSDPAKRPS